MFDLIGFWGNVTFLTVVLLSPYVVLVLPLLVHHFVYKVTQDKSKAKSAENKVWNNHNSSGNYSDIFGTRIHDIFLAFGVIGGGFFSPVLIVAYFTTGRGVVEIVAGVSTACAPYTSTAFLCIGVYIGAIVTLRKAYTAYIKVEKVLQKVSKDETE